MALILSCTIALLSQQLILCACACACTFVACCHLCGRHKQLILLALPPTSAEIDLPTSSLYRFCMLAASPDPGSLRPSRLPRIPGFLVRKVQPARSACWIQPGCNDARHCNKPPPLHVHLRLCGANYCRILIIGRRAHTATRVKVAARADITVGHVPFGVNARDIGPIYGFKDQGQSILSTL